MLYLNRWLRITPSYAFSFFLNYSLAPLVAYGTFPCFTWHSIRLLKSPLMEFSDLVPRGSEEEVVRGSEKWCVSRASCPCAGPQAKQVWVHNNHPCKSAWWKHMLYINNVYPW